MLGRLKFEITELVDEMLDQIPASLFERDDTTFLDPAMGGGQFVSRIEQRLREAGHSDENIAGRVFGIEINRMRLNYAVNKHSLVGKYQATDFLAWETDMKFDVVIGNPPYQSDKENSDKLWPSFIERAVSVAVDNGIISMITPDTWGTGTRSVALTGRKNILSDIFLANNLTHVSFDVKKYFPGIGSTFSYWSIVKGQAYQKNTIIKTPQDTFQFDLSGITGLPKNISAIELQIFKKIVTHSPNSARFEFKFASGLGIDFSDIQSDEYPYPYFNVGYGHPIQFGNVANRNDEPKIHLKYLGQDYEFDLDLTGEYSVMHNGRIFQISNLDVSIEGFETFFNSNLVKFMVNRNKRHHRNNEPKIINMMPIISLNKAWTDEELYAQFGLTQEEIDYIEQTVK